MSDSFEALFSGVVRWTRQPLATADDVAAVCADALSLYHSHHRRFKGPWDLAKLVSSAIRCSLACPSDACRPTAALLSLLAVAFHVCPCPPCTRLSVSAKTRCYRALDARLSADLQVSLAANTREGVLVVVSLLSLWLRIECGGGGGGGHGVSDSFSLLACFVGGSIPLLGHIAHHPRGRSSSSDRSSAPSDTTETTIYAQSWASNVLDFGLQHPQHASTAVEILLQSHQQGDGGGELATRLAGRSSSVQQQWRKLLTAVLAASRPHITQYCDSVRDVWGGTVRPILGRAFAQEPAPFVEWFYAAPLLTEKECGLLATEALPALHVASCSDALSGVFHQLDRLRHVDAFLHPQPAGHLSEDCAAFIRTVVVVALRTGRTQSAASLLAWLGDGGEQPTCSGGSDAQRTSTVNWVRRLEVLQRGDELPGSQMEFGNSDKDNAPSWDLWVSQKGAELDAERAIDIVATSNDLIALRVVLDNCLGCRQRDAASGERAVHAWAGKVLADPFCSVLLCRAAAKVVHLLLNDGDAVLARVYLTRMALCVRVCPSSECLLLLLQVLARMGHVFSSEAGLIGYPYGGDTACERWGTIYRCLHSFLPASPHLPYSVGRVKWQSYSQEADDRSTQTEMRSLPFRLGATLVSVRFEGEDVMLERRWHTTTGTAAAAKEAPPSFAVLRLANKRGAMRGLLVRARAVASDNRLQLLQGNTSDGATAEAAAARVDTDGGEPIETSNTTQDELLPNLATDKHGRKLAWWTRRFELDAEMFTVVEDLEETVGLVGLAMFLGEPSSKAQTALWELAGQLIDALASDPVNRDVKGILLAGSEFRSLAYSILQALPFLVSSEAKRRTEGEPKLGVAYTFCSHMNVCTAAVLDSADGNGGGGGGGGASCLRYCADERCLCRPGKWHALSRGLATAVNELLALAFAAVGNTPNPTDTPDDSPPVPQEEGDAEVYERVARAAVRTLSDAATGAAVSVDLTHVPRQHVYMTLPNEMHGLPFEGMRTLRSSSCSRLSPSLLAAVAAPPCSLRRTLLLADSDALASHRALEKLLAEHPDWSVEYRDTSAAADRSGKGLSWHAASLSPPRSSVLQRLTDDRITCYVYMGHRRGETVVSARELCSRLPGSDAAGTFPGLVMLMGCSSARVVGGAHFRCAGMPQAYLHAGARSFIGCLWDITDGDMDKLTWRFLKLASLATTPTKKDDGGAREERCPLTVGEVLAAARMACKLPSLSATATILYGLNCLLDA